MADLPRYARLAGRVTDWRGMDDHDNWAMATRITPTRVVAIASSFPADASELTVAFYPGPETVRAKVVMRDELHDLVFLETPPDYDAPHHIGVLRLSPSQKCGTYFIAPPGEMRYVTDVILSEGLAKFAPVEGMHAARGAPLFQDGFLYGILKSYAGEGSWTFVPAPEIRDPTDEIAASTFDAFFFHRLTAGARRALSYAAGAASGGPVEPEHLLHGLYENYAGTTRRLFRARNVSAPSFDAEPVPLRSTPSVDADVMRALSIAMKHADARKERQIRGRHILYGALSVAPFQGLTAADVQLDDPRSVVGHRADTVDGEDLLDIKREARVLAGVLGAATVEPPISLGLFGEWGSGKSFFMRELERQFTEVEGHGGYCRNIVQIWFNAWHYIDTPNLWASLAAEIFERLDLELTKREDGRPSDEATRASALARSAKARSDLASVSAERTQLESKLEQVESGLAELRDERTVSASLGARPIFNEVVAPVREKVDEKTIAAFRETTDRAKALLLAAKTLPRMSWLLVILFALTAVAAVQYGPELAATGAIGILLTTLGTWLSPAGKVVRTLYDAWQKKNALIETRRKELERPLVARKDELEEQLAKKKAEEEKKTAELQQHEAAVAALEPRRQMSNFIRERKASTVYTSRLGVIATAHDDFAELSRLLRRATSDPGTPTVDRIVLYIDDLDRCPEDKVVDVLQAVHLLLAFPLFIVVVGVDSRWLLHSLQRHLKQFDASDALSKELWSSTPLNYLEKIFQIPFTIRRMRAGAFGDLIENLARTSEPPPAPVKAEQPPESAAPPPAPVTAVPASAPPQQQQTEMKAAPAAKAVETTNVDYLTLHKWETEDMKVMYPLIPSPRAAKRFVNTYRLLRGMVDEYEQAAFVGDGAALAGDYRAALLMLAMLTGYPEETTEILRELLNAAAPDPDWWSFVEARVKGEPLREHLAAIKPALIALPPTATFAKWAPHVARFSFHSGRVVSAGPILGAT